MGRPRVVECVYCRGAFEARRSDASTCSDACRQAVSRARRGAPKHGTRGAAVSAERQRRTGRGELGTDERTWGDLRARASERVTDAGDRKRDA